MGESLDSGTARAARFETAGSSGVLAVAIAVCLGLLIRTSGALPVAGPLTSETTCPGDCNADGNVSVDELVTIVSIILGTAPDGACAAAPAQLDVSDVVAAINSVLTGCFAAPTRTPTTTPLPTPTEIVFELAEGSRIIHSAGGGMSEHETLTGRLVLQWVGLKPQFFIYRFVDASFVSPRFSIETSDDFEAIIRASFACPRVLLVGLPLLVNGLPLGFNGEAPVSCADFDSPDISSMGALTLCDGIGHTPASCREVREGQRRGLALEIIPRVVQR